MQLLSGRGCFQAHLERFEIVEGLNCGECGTPQYAIYKCSKWEVDRILVNMSMGKNISSDDTMASMIEDKHSWEHCSG